MRLSASLARNVRCERASQAAMVLRTRTTRATRATGATRLRARSDLCAAMASARALACSACASPRSRSWSGTGPRQATAPVTTAAPSPPNAPMAPWIASDTPPPWGRRQQTQLLQHKAEQLAGLGVFTPREAGQQRQRGSPDVGRQGVQAQLDQVGVRGALPGCHGLVRRGHAHQADRSYRVHALASSPFFHHQAALAGSPPVRGADTGTRGGGYRIPAALRPAGSGCAGRPCRRGRW